MLGLIFLCLREDFFKLCKFVINHDEQRTITIGRHALAGYYNAYNRQYTLIRDITFFRFDFRNKHANPFKSNIDDIF